MSSVAIINADARFVLANQRLPWLFFRGLTLIYSMQALCNGLANQIQTYAESVSAARASDSTVDL